MDATNGMMRNANVVEAWRLQRQWLERVLAARQEADSELARITGDLERRLEDLGRPRTSCCGSPSMASSFASKARPARRDRPFNTREVLQVTLYKKSTLVKGMWTGAQRGQCASSQRGHRRVEAMDLPAAGRRRSSPWHKSER